MRRFFHAAIVLLLIAAVLGVCAAEGAEQPSHNYIFIIDNSRSTTGRHSLGSATDPKGLRFDATKLVYDNVLSSAGAGGAGQIGVIVFCGSENCAVYGPIAIASDPAALDAAIGSHLNEKANEDKRDNYTDIQTALDAARNMLMGFEGETSVILLTDGVNDLVNRADPFSQPENIAANDQSVAIVADMRRLGADFYVIALTAQDAVQNTDAFMAFINRMAEAGGGAVQPDGSYGNVLMATQSDLNSKLLQMLIRAESTVEANVQTDAQYTPVHWPFTVPYVGINDATVNLTFMPEDKPKLQTVTLTAPDGKEYIPYDGGAKPGNDYTVTEDRSYIMLGIPSPKPGEWTVNVTGKNDARVAVSTVVRFNHKLRVHVEAPKTFNAGEPETIAAWFQRFDGERYVDLTDSDIYDMSSATLTVLSPGDDGKLRSVGMKRKGSRFTAAIKLKTLGTWMAEVVLRNDYVAERVNDLTFEVIPAPTATPEPKNTVKPSTTVTDNRMVVKTGDGGFSWQIDADPAGGFSVSWAGNGADDAVGALWAPGADTPVITDIRSGDTIDASLLDENMSYGLLLTAFSGGQDEGGTPPPIQKIDLRIVPDADAVGQAVLSVADAMVKLSPSMPSSQEDIHSAVQAVKALQESAASEGQTITMDEAGMNAAISDAGLNITSTGEVTGGTGGALFTQEDLDRLTGALTASYQQTVESDGLTLPDAGFEGDSSALTGGGSLTKVETDAGYDAELTAEALTDKPTATPKPVPTDIPAPTAEPVKPGIVDTLKANWMFIAGGAGALLLIALAAFVIREKSGEKVIGDLKISCDSLKLDMLVRFDGQVKVGAPLTKHPKIAKLNNRKLRDVLSNVTVGMVHANSQGMVPDSDEVYMSNEKLIRLSCTDPRTNAEQVCYVGRIDKGDSTLNVSDAGRVYELHFNGSLTLDELMTLSHRR